MSHPPAAADEVVVVGGGVIGLSVAFELLRAGRGVHVIERDRCGSGASRAAAGMLAPVSEAETAEPELVRFGQDSLGRYAEFVRAVETTGGGSCGYRTEGTLWAAIDRDNAEEIERLGETLRLKGLTARVLDAREIVELEPHLSPRVLGGLRVEQDHQVDTRGLLGALERAVLAAGGTITCGVAIVEITERSGRVRAVTGRAADGGRFVCEVGELVLAAGAWSGGEIRSPLGPIALRPVKGQMLRLRGRRLLRHVVRTPEVYLVPQADGELLLGATMEEMGFDTAPTAGAVWELLRDGRAMLPGLDDLELGEVAVGFRPAFADHLPRIGASEIEGLYLALGHFRHGVLLAPATAHYLARWIVGHERPAELEPFDPGARAVATR